MMEYRDRVRIAAMQILMQQGGISADDIAKKAEVFADAMCSQRATKNVKDTPQNDNY